MTTSLAWNHKPRAAQVTTRWKFQFSFMKSNCELIRGGRRLRAPIALAGQHGIESLATRWTPINGQMHRAPEESKSSIAVLSGNPLHFQAAAPGAMREADKWQGDRPSVEAVLAIAAPPRSHPGDSQQMINDSTPMGTPAGLAQAARADHFELLSTERPPGNIGPARSSRNRIADCTACISRSPLSLAEIVRP